MSLGRIAGPLWAGFAFDMNFDYPYLSGAAILFIGFLISLMWVTQDHKAAVSREPHRRSARALYPVTQSWHPAVA